MTQGELDQMWLEIHPETDKDKDYENGTWMKGSDEFLQRVHALGGKETDYMECILSEEAATLITVMEAFGFTVLNDPRYWRIYGSEDLEEGAYIVFPPVKKV